MNDKVQSWESMFALLCLLVGAMRWSWPRLPCLPLWRWWSGTFGPFGWPCPVRGVEHMITKWLQEQQSGLMLWFVTKTSWHSPQGRNAPWFSSLVIGISTPSLFSVPVFTSSAPSVLLWLVFGFWCWPLALFFIFVKFLQQTGQNIPTSSHVSFNEQVCKSQAHIILQLSTRGSCLVNVQTIQQALTVSPTSMENL